VTTLLQVLFYAAGQLGSLFAACERLRDAPSDQAVRDALAALCPEAETLEQQLNASFAAQLPKAVKQRRWHLAIALNLRPYYGKPIAVPRSSTAVKPKAARPTSMPMPPALSSIKGGATPSH
jgi:hypothetical protein